MSNLCSNVNIEFGDDTSCDDDYYCCYGTLLLVLCDDVATSLHQSKTERSSNLLLRENLFQERSGNSNSFFFW